MSTATLYHECYTVCRSQQLIPIGGTVIVAVSGGADSVALLHVLASMREAFRFEVHVATLDHGLRDEDGATDADFVEQLAAQWQLPCTRYSADVQNVMTTYGLGLEVAARLTRYTFLLQVALANNAQHIALAHHQNDQAETILMHLIRGSGLDGLSGMSAQTQLSETHLLPDWETQLEIEPDDFVPEDIALIRPLLSSSRSSIDAYIETHELPFRTDTTNTDTTRLRNAIRHELLPLLRTYNRNIDSALTRLGNIVQHDRDVLTSQVDRAAAWLLDWIGTRPATPDEEPGEAVFVDKDGFREQPIGIQRRLIRKIIEELWPGAQDIALDLVESARHLILTGQTSAQLSLYEDITLRIGYDDVLIGYGGAPLYPTQLPGLAPGETHIVELDTATPTRLGQLELVSYWVIEGRSTDLRPTTPLEVTLAVPEDATVALRTWQHGDRFCPLGMNGKSQKLSDTFVNAKVPVYYRDQVPLLTINGEIAWIVAPTASGPISKIADTFAVRRADDAMLRLRWQMPTLLPLT